MKKKLIIAAAAMTRKKKSAEPEEKKKVVAFTNPKKKRPAATSKPPTKRAAGAPTAFGKQSQKGDFKPKIEKNIHLEEGDTPLNKYLAHSGICSRRKAVELIANGLVLVNNLPITEPSYRVQPADVVTHQGNLVQPNTRKIYILLNKPKDTITTASDERGRKTVMDIVNKTIKERIYPVGRLDRETTGLLLLTNDGDLAEKLSHPRHQVKKAYHAELDKALTQQHLLQIQAGLDLEDGKIIVDSIGYVDGKKKTEIGIEIHSGKNRIVRRIFEHLGYEVLRLDRTYYAGLTKKDLPRSAYRSLTEREIVMLKHFT